MTKVAITEQYLTDIADAIRAKSGTSGGMTPADMASAISNIPSGGGTPALQSKTVSPTESTQTVTADAGYDGLSSVKVNAISSTYVGTRVTRKGAATITPGTTNKTIASGTYLTGKQTIAGDADLVAGNIKSGVNIFGVTGTYSGGGGGTLETVSITIDMSELSGGDYFFDIAGTQLDGDGLTSFTDRISGTNVTITFDAVVGTNVTISSESSPGTWWCYAVDGNVEEIWNSNLYVGCVRGADTILIEE